MQKQVIGLAFVKPTVLQFLTRSKFDVRVYPGEGDWKKWLGDVQKGRRKVAVVQEKKAFSSALESGTPSVIVCHSDLDWMERRGIRCLDAARDGDNIKIVTITPKELYAELSKTPAYTASNVDIWRDKSNPAGRCAGCMHFAQCGHEPTPISRQPCGDRYEKDRTETAYRSYNLSQLVNLAVNSADEEKMLAPPREFWQACYQFAVGEMTRNVWLTEHARMLKSAGCHKRRLQNIALWVKRYGKALQMGKVRNPPSKLDVKLTDKLVKRSSDSE